MHHIVRQTKSTVTKISLALTLVVSMSLACDNGPAGCEEIGCRTNTSIALTGQPVVGSEFELRIRMGSSENHCTIPVNAAACETEGPLQIHGVNLQWDDGRLTHIFAYLEPSDALALSVQADTLTLTGETQLRAGRAKEFETACEDCPMKLGTIDLK